jgi:hypothetical protein
MKTIVIADIYGLGCFVLSPGMLTLGEKIEGLGENFVVLGPYNQTEWERAAVDLASRHRESVIRLALQEIADATRRRGWLHRAAERESEDCPSGCR